MIIYELLKSNGFIVLFKIKELLIDLKIQIYLIQYLN